MARANFACEECGDTRTTLNVHHKLYRAGAEPWDYTDDELGCWCENCHEAHHVEERIGPSPDVDASFDLWREWLLRKAEFIGLSYREKNCLSSLLRMARVQRG